MFDLPDEVIDIILNYLPVKDLLNASLVSKQWLNYIAECSSFRKKIVINSTFYSKPENLKKRKYESLRIRQPNIDSIGNLIEKFKWRSVYFNVQKISSQKSFVSLIKKLNHVKNLKVMNAAIRKLTDHKKLILPELEHLVFSDVAVDTFETFIALQPELKSLSIRFLTCDILNKRTVGEYVLDFLRLNGHLQELELYFDVVNALFKNDLTKVLSINLKSFSLNLCNTNDSVIRKNIEEFLKYQENSLEELKIIFQLKSVGKRRRVEVYPLYYDEEHSDDDIDEDCDDISILLGAWNNLSNLKKLTLRFFVNFKENEPQPSSMLKHLKPNNNIEVLNIKHINCTIPWNIVSIIIKLCPNVKFLYISKIDMPVIQTCYQNLKILRNLSYCIENADAIARYNALANSGANEINKFIKFHKECKG